jgi:peptidoglycan/LPS O-acetylase OafA/YrhL
MLHFIILGMIQYVFSFESHIERLPAWVRCGAVFGCLAVTVLVSKLVHGLVEEPARRRMNQWVNRRVSISAGTQAGPNPQSVDSA